MAEVREIEYDANPDFNQDFDETNTGKELRIADNLLKPSWMLYNTDYELYLTALDDFNERQYQDLIQSVYDNYPSIIAYNFRLSERGEGADDPVRKLLHLKDTWEAIIFILYALTFGEIRKKNINLQEVPVFHSGNPDMRFKAKIIMTDALKQKLENIKAIIQFSRDNDLNLLCENIEISLLDKLTELQDIRNDISHHAAPTREQAESELRDVQPIFSEMLKQTKFLETCRILRFSNLEQRCRCEIFNGHALNKEYDNFTFEGDELTYVIGLGNNSVFAFWESEIFSLSPFLHYEVDASGHESYLSFYKGKRENKYWFEPVKLREEKSYEDLQERFEQEKDELVRLLVPTT